MRAWLFCILIQKTKLKQLLLVLWLRSVWWLNPIKKVSVLKNGMQNDLTYSYVVFHIFPNTLLSNTSYSDHCELLLATSVALQFGNIKGNNC